jgi:carnitine O-acetyltransferase
MSSPSIRRADWKSLASFSLPGQTFAGQPHLPKLPVPDLVQSLERLKQSLKPIAWSDSEYEAAVAKVNRFGAGIAPELQQRLLKRREQTEHWLEEWLDRDSYLEYRDSILVNVSYYCKLPFNESVFFYYYSL